MCIILSKEVIAKVRNLPFDKLRVNGLRLKSLTFSVRGELVEPQKNTFAIGSKVSGYETRINVISQSPALFFEFLLNTTKEYFEFHVNSALAHSPFLASNETSLSAQNSL